MPLYIKAGTSSFLRVGTSLASNSACCCGGGCPECSGLPSTVSVEWTGTYTNNAGCEAPLDPLNPFDFLSQAVSISKTFLLSKSCDPGDHTYQGVACNIGTMNQVWFSCDLGELYQCIAWNIFASVCAFCNVDGSGNVSWTVYVSTYISPIREDCESCSCEQLYVDGVEGNSCSLLFDTYCLLNTPQDLDVPISTTKIGSSIFGSYSLGSGTIVIS
jgi:hypothetical protein